MLIEEMPPKIRVPAPEDIKNSRLFKAFHSIIQGLLPVDPNGTWERNTPIWSIRAWRLLIISSLSSSSTHLIANVAGSSHSHKVLLKVSHRQIPNFSRPSTRFPKQFKDIFSFMKFKDFSRPAQEPCKIQKWQKHNNKNNKYNFTKTLLEQGPIWCFLHGQNLKLRHC